MEQRGQLAGIFLRRHDQLSLEFGCSGAQALDILTSSKLRDALDLSRETPEVLARYGVDDPAFERDGAPRELVLQIDGPAASEIPASMRDDAPRPRVPKKKGPPRTIVIGSGEAPTASGE